MYEQGRGVEQNDLEAVRWYRAAAEQATRRQEQSLGWMYKEGRGVPQDDAKPWWYRQAADAGHCGGAEQPADASAGPRPFTITSPQSSGIAKLSRGRTLPR